MVEKFTPGFEFRDEYLEEYEIEETNLPHRFWGLEESERSYVVAGNHQKAVLLQLL